MKNINRQNGWSLVHQEATEAPGKRRTFADEKMRVGDENVRRKLKVLQLTSAHSVFDPRIFHKISRSLARAGYDVTLVVHHTADDHVSGVRIRSIRSARARLWRMTFSVFEIYREVLRQNADVVHFHDPELIPIGLLLKGQGKHVIYDVHEDLPRTFNYKPYLPIWLRRPLMWITEHIEDAAARHFTAIVAATPHIAERFRKRNSRTVTVNNYPILNEITTPPNEDWKQRDCSVAYVGSITRARGIDNLIHAMSMLPPVLPARLILAGWYSPETLQQELTKSIGWRRVDFVGSLERSMMPTLLSRVRAGVVVLLPEPNFVVSKPTKLFEYMSAGIPVIASDFPLWREIVEDAQCGLLVDPNEPRQTAAAIEYLLTHSAEAEQMGRRGRAAVERLYNWNTEEYKLLALYDSFIQRSALAAQAPAA